MKKNSKFKKPSDGGPTWYLKHGKGRKSLNVFYPIHSINFTPNPVEPSTKAKPFWQILIQFINHFRCLFFRFNFYFVNLRHSVIFDSAWPTSIQYNYSNHSHLKKTWVFFFISDLQLSLRLSCSAVYTSVLDSFVVHCEKAPSNKTPAFTQNTRKFSSLLHQINYL